MRTRPSTSERARRGLIAAAIACTLPGLALADFRSEGGGSFEVSPMYRALTFAGMVYDPALGYVDSEVDGLSYVSNTAPRTLATASTRVQADGTTFDGGGWSAYSGFYASRSYASMTVNNGNPDHSYYVVAGQGSTTSVQFFTAEAAAQRAVFTWRVTGSEGNPLNAGQATGRLDFAATTEQGKSWLDLFNGGFDNQITEFGTGTFTYSLPMVALGTPIYLHYWSSAFVEYLPGDVPAGSNFTATADFARTVVLEGVELFDADDQAISAWSLDDLTTGETVFDQDGRIAVVLPPPPIPEPGTWALMAAGLLLVGQRVRRRARRDI